MRLDVLHVGVDGDEDVGVDRGSLVEGMGMVDGVVGVGGLVGMRRVEVDRQVVDVVDTPDTLVDMPEDSLEVGILSGSEVVEHKDP